MVARDSSLESRLHGSATAKGLLKGRIRAEEAVARSRSGRLLKRERWGCMGHREVRVPPDKEPEPSQAIAVKKGEQNYVRLTKGQRPRKKSVQKQQGDAAFESEQKDSGIMKDARRAGGSGTLAVMKNG